MTRTKTLAIVASLAAVTLTAACSDANVHDYKGVNYHHPDSIKVWDNIDQHPNIARVCLDGVAFATTSRDAQAADQRVPEWDHLCPPAGAK